MGAGRERSRRQLVKDHRFRQWLQNEERSWSGVGMKPEVTQ